MAIIHIQDKITISARIVMLITPRAGPTRPAWVRRTVQAVGRAGLEEWIRTASECAATASPPVNASPMPIAALA